MSATINRTTGRRSFPISVAIVVVLLASVLLGCSWQSSTAQLVQEPVSQTLDGATRAEVEIALAVGQLRIGALDQPSELIAGEIAYPDRNSVTRTFAVQGDTASFSLREQDSKQDGLPRYNQKSPVWDLRLSSTTPTRLLLQTGVGENLIDLAQLQVTELTLESGVGATTVTLPRAGQVQARVDGGVGTTTIRVPAGVGVQLKVEAGLGNTTVPEAFRQQGEAYVSPDYETAAARVDLQAHTGIGNILIEQLGN